MIALHRIRNHLLNLFQVFFINITDGHHAGIFVSDVTTAHSAHTDDCFGKLVTGSSKTGSSEHVSRNYHDACHGKR